MSDLLMQSDSPTGWHELVRDATYLAGYQIDEALEHYLIVTLEKHTHDSNIGSSIIALDYLNAISLSTQKQIQKMRSVGDYCLLLSGLFPEHAIKRNVSSNYFIGMGKTAYHQLSSVSPHLKLDTQLFLQLSNEFTGLTNLLNIIRELPQQMQQ